LPLDHRSKPGAEVSYTGPCRIALQTPTILLMQQTSAPQIRRLVLVPATASGRGDELVRRYRLARLRLAGREGSPAPAPRKRI
jgi:hypothetical protein